VANKLAHLQIIEIDFYGAIILRPHPFQQSTLKALVATGPGRLDYMLGFPGSKRDGDSRGVAHLRSKHFGITNRRLTRSAMSRSIR